jgi:PhnB protein
MTIHELFPYLRVKDAGRAIEYYKQAFGATEKFRLTEPGGRIGHCELLFGSVTLMLSEEYPELGFLGPKSIGATSVSIHLHVDDADAAIERAIAAGGTLVRPASDAFYGERSGTVRDPFGHEWMLGHNIEDVTPDEMQRRYDELMKPC